jgi:hypothetical protein
VSLPPFSLSTRALPEAEEAVNVNLLKQVAFSTAVGQASSVQWTGEGGIIVFVKAKLPVDQARMDKDLSAFAQGLREKWQTEAFNEWFGGQFAKGVRSPLLDERKSPPANLAPSRPAKKT